MKICNNLVEDVVKVEEDQEAKVEDGLVEEAKDAKALQMMKNQMFSNKSQEDMVEVVNFKVVMIKDLMCNVIIVKDLGIML